MDPWDVEPNPLVVNDVEPSGDPSFVSVAMCIGTDFDENPILLVDRLCLNREAANIVKAEMDAKTQDAAKWTAQAEKCEQSLESARKDAATGMALFVVMLIVAVAAVGLAIRKA